MTSTTRHVEQITAMSEDIIRLAAVANQEGHRNLATLIREFRRNGTGSRLTRIIESLAARHFARIQLFTDSHAAGRFYASLGYRPVATRAKVSHEKWLNGR